MIDQELLANIKILYVEDDSSISSSITPAFNKLFKKFVLATDGEKGLELFKSEKFDIVVTDINMPNMDGTEMSRKIRAINDKIPIIITSAHSEAQYLMYAINNHIQRYLPKPINVKLLLIEIQDIIRDINLNNKSGSLKKENKDFIQIVNNVAMVTRVDLQGNLVYANKAFCEKSGFSEDELIGLNEQEIRYSSSSNDEPSPLEDMFEDESNGASWTGKIKNKLKDKDDEYFITSTSSFPLFDDDHKTYEYMSVSFCITEQEAERKTFRKKVMMNIKENKIKISEQKNITKALEEANEVVETVLKCSILAFKKFQSFLKPYSNLINTSNITQNL